MPVLTGAGGTGADSHDDAASTGSMYRFCNAQLMYITVSTVPVVHMLYDSTTLSSMVVGTIMLVHSTEYRVP